MDIIDIYLSKLLYQRSMADKAETGVGNMPEINSYYLLELARISERNFPLYVNLCTTLVSRTLLSHFHDGGTKFSLKGSVPDTLPEEIIGHSIYFLTSPDFEGSI